MPLTYDGVIINPSGWITVDFSEIIHCCMLCVTGLYVRDIANTYSRVSHLNVSRMSICASCSFTNAEVVTAQ